MPRKPRCENKQLDGRFGHAEARRRFENLYREWWAIAWFAARGILACHDDADDAAQRVFARLWSRASKGSLDIACPDAYFKQAGRREAVRISRERRETAPLTDEFILRSTFGGPTPERQAARAELRRIQRCLIDELPPRCRRVMRLVEYDGLTHAEVAKALGIGLGAVEKQVTRAYAHFRKRLAAMFPKIEILGLSTFVDGGGLGV